MRAPPVLKECRGQEGKTSFMNRKQSLSSCYNPVAANDSLHPSKW